MRMSLHKVIGAATALLVSHGAAAQGEWRCDCTSVVESCTAEVAVRGSFIEITSDHRQCSRVDYFVDGLPFVAVVVEGADRQDWIARTDNPRVLVQSCQVCRDNASAAPAQRAPVAPAGSAAADGSGELLPLIQVQPAYPPAAFARRVSGSVEVELTVDPKGEVASARVVSGQPPNVFDQAALAAVQRWRYRADPEREPQTIRARVLFDPAQASAAPQPQATPAPAPAQAEVAGPRNQCVREGAVYHFGDMVQIGLLNACDEPLLVFGCAPGTGRSLGRWACADSESQGSVLVQPSDRRVGNQTALPTADGPRAFTYADTFSVTRAPNTQYWWVACAPDDSECRADARQWTRAVDGQAATIDPKDRSPIAVAQSH
jgi:TonB family protein